MASCNNEKKDDKQDDNKKETVKSGSDVSLPYKTEYSSFSMGDPSHTKLVLDFYKTFEENRMDDGKAMLTDSVAVNFADGSKFMGTKDSLISMGKQYRSAYADVKITIDACIVVHSNDKNEDWLLIWDKSVTKDTKGKIDSIGGQSYWLIKDGKITFWGESQAKLAPAPTNK
ncbi:MAG: hypothetical protein FJY20_02755 [Bacteroidetes bacterium]|nr:hypothetical protein [Bacteroidota bacterium]